MPTTGFPVPESERTAERSGLHLTGEDSGYPVASSEEPGPTKDGDGDGPQGQVTAIADGAITGTGEIQTARQSVAGDTGTTFTLTVAGQTTAGIALNASAATVQTALEALSNVDAGDVEVRGAAGGPWTIEFLEAGQHGDTNMAAITGDGVGVNEVQTLTITGTPTGGDFTLTYAGQTTAPIAYNANAAAVDSALEALSNIGAGDVTCGGGALPGTPVTITFTAALAEGDRALVTADGAGLTGGSSPAAAVATTTPGKTGPTIVVFTDATGS